MPNAVPGEVHVSNDVLADLAGNATSTCYGVVGMAAPSSSDGITSLLPQGRWRRGVEVVSEPEGVRVTVRVVIEYGTNINVVSQNVVEAVTFALGEYAQVPIAGIDVVVAGVKVRK